MHHVEILKDKETGKFSGMFIPMMEAHRRAMTGTDSAKKRGVVFEPIVKKDHGQKRTFIMALHRNDIVSLRKNGRREYYRVQKFKSLNKQIILRLHTAATIKNDSDTFLARESTIPALMKNHLKLHKVNTIGKILND